MVWPGVTMLSTSLSALVEVERFGVASTVSVSDDGDAPAPPSAAAEIVAVLLTIVPSFLGVLTVAWKLMTQSAVVVTVLPVTLTAVAVELFVGLPQLEMLTF